MNKMEWTAKEIRYLRVLWDEGHSGTAIARLMKTTKSAIIGKAHRLKLPSRQSPIAFSQAAKPQPVKARESAIVAAAVVEISVERVKEFIAEKPVQPAAKACQFPHGDPRKPSFHFCGAEAAPGRPYCTDHVLICYVRVPDRKAA